MKLSSKTAITMHTLKKDFPNVVLIAYSERQTENLTHDRKLFLPLWLYKIQKHKL